MKQNTPTPVGSLRLPAATTAVFLAFAFGWPLQAQTPAEELFEEGIRLLGSDLAGGIEALQQAVNSLDVENPLWARLTFRAAFELKDTTGVSSGDVSTRLQNAELFYRRMLRSEPENSHAQLGLARVFELSQQPDSAQSYFTAALESYGALALAPPYRTQAHDSLVAIAIGTGWPGFPDYLWEALSNGRFLNVSEAAVDALEAAASPSGLDSTVALPQVVTIVASSLAADFYDPSTFDSTAIGQRVVALSGSQELPSDIVAALTQLVAWHEGPPSELLTEDDACDPEPDRLAARRVDWTSWWSDPSPKSGGQSRADASRELIRSLGNWHEQNGPNEDAAAFYCLALHLETDRLAAIEPKTPQTQIDTTYAGLTALRDLSWLYVIEDRVKPIETLHDQFKGAFESDVELIPIDEEMLHNTPAWLFWAPPVLGVFACILFCPGDDKISGTVIVQGS